MMEEILSLLKFIVLPANPLKEPLKLQECSNQEQTLLKKRKQIKY